MLLNLHSCDGSKVSRSNIGDNKGKLTIWLVLLASVWHTLPSQCSSNWKHKLVSTWYGPIHDILHRQSQRGISLQRALVSSRHANLSILVMCAVETTPQTMPNFNQSGLIINCGYSNYGTVSIHWWYYYYSYLYNHVKSLFCCLSYFFDPAK